MLELLDTGRMAYKFGKWRGVLYLVATLAPLIIATFILSIFGILPGKPTPPAAIEWIGMILYGLALALGMYGCHQLYRDQVHHDYYLEADRYKHEGW